MICSNCGTKCSDSSTKCPKCGKKLDDFVFEVIDDSDNNEFDISYAKKIEYDFDDTDEIDAETINACAAEVEELEKKGMFEPGAAQRVKYEQRYGENHHQENRVPGQNQGTRRVRKKVVKKPVNPSSDQSQAEQPTSQENVINNQRPGQKQDDEGNTQNQGQRQGNGGNVQRQGQKVRRKVDPSRQNQNVNVAETTANVTGSQASATKAVGVTVEGTKVAAGQQGQRPTGNGQVRRKKKKRYVNNNTYAQNQQRMNDNQRKSSMSNPAEEIEEPVEELFEEPLDNVIQNNENSDYQDYTVEFNDEYDEGYNEEYSEEYQENDEDDYQEYREYNFAKSNDLAMEESNIRREPARPPKISKGKKTVILAVIVLIATSIASVYFISKRAMLDKFDAALHNNEYSDAVTLYGSLMQKSKTEADKMIADKIDDIFERYQKGTISSSDSKNELSELGKIDSEVKTKIEEASSDFDGIIESEACFTKAEEYLKSKDYENAIIEFYKVIEADNHYDTAQTKLKSASDEFKKEKFAQADEYVVAGNYGNAVKILKYCSQRLPKDDEIAKKLEEYSSKMFDLDYADIKSDIDNCTAKADYAGALKVINNAIKTYGEIEKLTTAAADNKKELYTQLDGYVNDKRYNKLVSVLEDYVKVDSADAKVNEMLTKYKPMVTGGYDMATLELTNVKGKCYITPNGTEYRDYSGKVFETSVEVAGYSNLEKSGSFVIKNNKYTKLAGTIGYSNFNYYQSGSGKITIKADDKVIYTSEVINKKSKDVSVDADIPAGCSKITFSWESADKEEKPYGIVLGNFSFSTAAAEK